MRTAIVSDLHLGSASGEDVAREAGVRRVLLEEIAGADRLVLLGDALELRERPLAQALAATRPFFEELGEAMAGRPVLLVPGNHDHRLAEPLLEAVALAGEPLGLEHRAAPAGEAGARLAAWLGPAELSIAYPGLWLRPDVYATHGHYMDCHWTLPRLECVAAAASMRATGPLPERATPAEYERVLRPVYGLSFGIAQGGGRRNSRPSAQAWRALSGRNGRRGALLRASVPPAVWMLNRVLRSGFEHDLSAKQIARGGIEAAAEMSRRLGVGGAHVITGHTHRAIGAEEAWDLDDGGRLYNAGSWVFADAFHRPGTPPGPYWPGTVAWVEESGPPRLKNLLTGADRDGLKRIAESLAA